MDLRGVKRVVNGRSLAIVGNASSVLDGEYGEEIDDADVVVRFNTGLPAESDKWPNIGKRTTILAGNYFSRVLWVKAGMPMIIYCKTKRCGDDSGVGKWEDPKPHVYTAETSANLLGLMERPSCGLITVCFLLERGKPRSVKLFGFDFFETPTWYWTFIAQSPHDGDKERIWFQNQGFVDRGDGSFEWVSPSHLERRAI